MELTKCLENIDLYINSLSEIITAESEAMSDKFNPNLYIESQGRLTGFQIGLDYLEAVRLDVQDAINTVLDNSINTDIGALNTLLKGENQLLQTRVNLLEKENKKLICIESKNKKPNFESNSKKAIDK